MDINNAFPSKYLSAADLKGKKVRVVMDRFEMDEMNDGKKKIVVYFKGAQKGLALNRTNATTIADMYGNDTDGWVGKEISLFPTRVDFQGKRVDAIRIDFIQPPIPEALKPRLEQSQRSAQTEANPPTHASILDDMNDEVPF